MHALNIAGALLDHGHVFHAFDDAQNQLHRHVSAAGGRVVVEHDRHADALANSAVVSEDFRLGELPVRSRQHHHHIGTVGFGETCAAHGFDGGQVRDADDGWHPFGDVLDAELGNLIPLRIAQVSAFASAAQRRDGVDAAVDQAIDRLPERWHVQPFAVGAERGDGVADDAVNSGHGNLSVTGFSSGNRRVGAGSAGRNS
ncbi:hypothetical protein D3C72_1033760 [compost metagenome]